MEAMSELRQAHRTAALIAGGLITGLVMYAVIASVFRDSQAPFAVVVGLPAFRRVLLRRRPDDTRAAAIARLTLTTVAVGGLSELPAVAGFVLVILGGLFLDFYLLGAFSLGLLLANFPRYEAWEEWLATPAPRP
jgi:hypothetical protein